MCNMVYSKNLLTGPYRPRSFIIYIPKCTCIIMSVLRISWIDPVGGKLPQVTQICLKLNGKCAGRPNIKYPVATKDTELHNVGVDLVIWIIFSFSLYHQNSNLKMLILFNVQTPCCDKKATFRVHLSWFFFITTFKRFKSFLFALVAPPPIAIESCGRACLYIYSRPYHLSVHWMCNMQYKVTIVWEIEIETETEIKRQRERERQIWVHWMCNMQYKAAIVWETETETEIETETESALDVHYAI